MTALTGVPVCPVTRKLIALLEDRSKSSLSERALSFVDKLAALELEAIMRDVAPTTLGLIRIARETVDFAERIATGSRQA